jgi:LysM repeat protein
LQTDFTFALKRLEDRSILDLLSASKNQTEEGTKFCIELLRSSRADAILQAAAQTLYSYVGELAVAPIDPQVVLARFAPQQVAVDSQPVKNQNFAPDSARFHIVKEGENLWKISRLYKVKVDEIVQLNGLEKESLFPGMTLKVPQGTGSEPPR